MNALTNNAGLSLSMAVWLAHDDYDNGASEHVDKDLMSATTLLKSTRATILATRVSPTEVTTDVTDRIASRVGTAIHDSIESAWKNNYVTAMKAIGQPQKMIDRVCINPEDKDLSDEIIPVYLEQRGFRTVTVDGHEIIISGQFDQIINGELNDVKTTSVWSYLGGNKEEDYVIQMSIYRWIQSERVTSNMARVQFVFTDWQRMMVKTTPGYPPHRVHELVVELMSLTETEAWIKRKLRELINNQGLKESEIVRCTNKELWMSDPSYKFYSDPKKAAEGGRSTKNFTTYPEAAAHKQKAGKGVIVTIQAQAKACGYCPAAPVCNQRLEYGDNS
jgi:hypothetical protein